METVWKYDSPKKSDFEGIEKVKQLEGEAG